MNNSVNEISLYEDGIGYVRVLDILGDQYTPAEDARTSTGKGKVNPDADAKLQNRLMVDRHTSPFEGVVIKIEMQVPLFVLREIDRHRTLTKVGEPDELDSITPDEHSRKWFARNEMSGRYIQLPALYYFPQKVRMQSKQNAQSTADAVAVEDSIAQEFLDRGENLTAAARELYDWAVQNGVEKGLARIFNTQNQYTRIRMTGSLKNWLDFLSLRLPKDVLFECREVSLAIYKLLDNLFPSPVSQWYDKHYMTVTLSNQECEAVFEALRSYDEEFASELLTRYNRKAW